MPERTIWIDADSCPLLVRTYTAKFGFYNQHTVNFVANKPVTIDEEFPFNMIIVEKGKDSADNYIFNNSIPGDLVITRDIVFADRLVKKEIACINDRGTEFNAENLKKLLEDREFDMQIANCGLVKHFHEGYDTKKFKAFRECFVKVSKKIGL